MKTLLLTIISVILTISQLNSQNRANIRVSDSLIVTALANINADSLQASMQTLQDMGTRFMISPNRKEVATWIMNKYLSYGIAEVRLDSFLCYTDINYPPVVYDTTTWQYNVEARIEGITVPEEEVVLMGHYDCFANDPGPLYFAPGADDNASGTAAALECARVIMEMGYQPEQTLIFLASAAEELMYFGGAGTEYYAEEAQAAGRNIVMAINNDMIAWNDGTWTLDLFNHTLSPHITSMAIDIIENYTSLNYKSWQPQNEVGADIQPFLDAGYNGIYFMEHYINPEYHTINDVIENCDIPYLAEATRVSLGMILHSDITVGQEEIGTALQEIEIYPNPAADYISFRLKHPWHSSIDVKITGMNGAVVYQAHLPTKTNILDISFLPGGFYMMIFSSGDDVHYKKFVIARQ